MYNVEPVTSNIIEADGPEQAVQKFISKKKDPDYYNVWKLGKYEFYIIYHHPSDDKRPEFEITYKKSREETEKLVKAMMYNARCDDDCLAQICGMASTFITDRESYDNWIGERDEYDD